MLSFVFCFVFRPLMPKAFCPQACLTRMGPGPLANWAMNHEPRDSSHQACNMHQESSITASSHQAIKASCNQAMKKLANDQAKKASSNFLTDRGRETRYLILSHSATVIGQLANAHARSRRKISLNNSASHWEAIRNQWRMLAQCPSEFQSV